jgi:hypothetical protein
VREINRLLAQAGFQRAVVTGSGRHPANTEGFAVGKYPGGVIVNWWPDTTVVAGRTAEQVDQERRTQLEMIRRYAEAIEGAGWSVKIKVPLGTVAVYPKAGDPGR